MICYCDACAAQRAQGVTPEPHRPTSVPVSPPYSESASTPPTSMAQVGMMARALDPGADRAARAIGGEPRPSFSYGERLTKALSDYARGKARLEELDGERQTVARELVKLEGAIEVLKEIGKC